VTRIQAALVCAGFRDWLGAVPRDGNYGPSTNAALHCLKCQHNLQPTYFDDVGPKTMHCLNKIAWDSACQPEPAPDKDIIAAAQNTRALNLTIAKVC
jgi:hypothetical protein